MQEGECEYLEQHERRLSPEQYKAMETFLKDNPPSQWENLIEGSELRGWTIIRIEDNFKILLARHGELNLFINCFKYRHIAEAIFNAYGFVASFSHFGLLSNRLFFPSARIGNALIYL